MSKIIWDPKQKDIIDHKGDIIISGGRQWGKSFAVSRRTAEHAKEYPKTTTLIMAASDKQEAYLLAKTHDWLKQDKALSKTRQLLSKLTLKNGSTIIKHAPGQTGFLMKGLTVDFLVVDEAPYMAERVWDSIMPMIMLARSKGLGWRTFLGSPFGKKGFFYKCWIGGKFKVVHGNTEECPRMQTPEGKAFLAEEKERMTEREYAQEYLGEFLEDDFDYFPTEKIKECMNFKFWDHKVPSATYLGIDIAGMGSHEEAFVCGKLEGKKVTNFHNEVLTKSTLQDTVAMTRRLDKKLNFKRIFIDSSGIGEGYLDIMKENFGRRVVGLNYASKSIDKQKKILKEDLYSNVLKMMELGTLSLIVDDKMRKSLQGIQQIDGKIGGKDDHLSDALTYMCWCIKHKGLNLKVV